MIDSKGLLTAQAHHRPRGPASANDVGVMALPLAHLFGFGLTLISMSGGLTNVHTLVRPAQDLKGIEDSKATILVGVPAMYSMACSRRGSTATTLDGPHLARPRTRCR